MNVRASRWRTDAAEAVASLPMYDFPDLQEAHDALWDLIAARLHALGVTRARRSLMRGEAGEAAWSDPRLLLS